MTGVCKDCKWWDAEGNPSPGYGSCGLASDAWLVPPHTKVVVMAGDAPQTLVTALDFGCNEFEAKS